MSWWPAMVFGWPAVIVAFVIATWGIVRSKPVLLVAAALIISPFSLYLGGSPRYAWAGVMIPLLFVGAAFSARYRKPALGWALLMPAAAVAVSVAILVVED